MDRFLKYKILLLSLVAVGFILPVALSAQHYVGVRAGYGGGTTRIFPKEDTRTLWGLYNAGVSWKYYSPEKYVGGVEADILFMQQGYINHSSPYDSRSRLGSEYTFPRRSDQFPDADTTIHEKRYVNSVMVPLFWQPHVYMFRRHMRVYLNLGLTFSYNINQSFEILSDEQEEPLRKKSKDPMDRVKFNRFGYGLCGGGGIGWTFGKIEVLAEMRYYIGYSDLMKNRNKYRDNPLRSPLDGLQGSVGVYYRFGKKGILSPPSKNMERKLREIEEKRMARALEGADPVEDAPLDPVSDPDSPLFENGEAVPGQAPDEMAIAAL